MQIYGTSHHHPSPTTHLPEPYPTQFTATKTSLSPLPSTRNVPQAGAKTSLSPLLIALWRHWVSARSVPLLLLSIRIFARQHVTAQKVSVYVYASASRELMSRISSARTFVQVSSCSASCALFVRSSACFVLAPAANFFPAKECTICLERFSSTN